MLPCQFEPQLKRRSSLNFFLIIKAFYHSQTRPPWEKTLSKLFRNFRTLKMIAICVSEKHYF
jgi:hypothetical protein